MRELEESQKLILFFTKMKVFRIWRDLIFNMYYIYVVVNVVHIYGTEYIYYIFLLAFFCWLSVAFWCSFQLLFEQKYLDHRWISIVLCWTSVFWSLLLCLKLCFMFLLSRTGLVIYFKNEWMNMTKQATRKNKLQVLLSPPSRLGVDICWLRRKVWDCVFEFTRMTLYTLDDIWCMDVYCLMYRGSFRTYSIKSILSLEIQMIKSHPVHKQSQWYSNVTFINMHDSYFLEIRNCTSLLWEGVISQKSTRAQTRIKLVLRTQTYWAKTTLTSANCFKVVYNIPFNTKCFKISVMFVKKYML